jgi:hypothetical protein
MMAQARTFHHRKKPQIISASLNLLYQIMPGMENAMKEVVGELCDNRCLPILYTLYIIYRGGLRKKKETG